MAAQPVLQKLERFIAKQGGDEYIFEQLREGLTVGAISGKIVLPGHGKISRPFLYTWRNQHDDRKRGWDEAMRDSAHALVEDAGDVLDELAGPEKLATSAEVGLARSRSEFKRWLASKRHDKYTDRPAEVNVAIVTGPEAFHTALAKHGRRAALPAPTQVLPDADVEVVE